MRVEKLIGISLVILCGTAPGLRAAPKQPGAAGAPLKSVQPPCPGLYTATITPDPVARMGPNGMVTPSCGADSKALGHYVYYYPGPGQHGGLWIENAGNLGGTPGGSTYVGWDPNFLHPLKSGGVTLV